MSIEIQFTDDDKTQVADNHSDGVAERFEALIEQKNDTLQWKNSLHGAKQRFYNVIEENGKCFPELYFHVDRREYRAVLAWIDDLEVFAFLCIVEKNDHYQSSRQHEILELIHQNPHRVVTETRKELA